MPGRHRSRRCADAHRPAAESVGAVRPADHACRRPTCCSTTVRTYSAAGMEFETRDIPGHSSGHVVFVWRRPQPAVVFGGDVLFSGSIGRTDFPGGSFETLVSGIREEALHAAGRRDRSIPATVRATTVGRREADESVRRDGGLTCGRVDAADPPARSTDRSTVPCPDSASRRPARRAFRRVNVAPWPGSLSTRIRPPCSRMIF